MRRVAFLLVVSLLTGVPALQAQDAFEQRRATELAAMTGVDPIYLTFVEGRSSYRIGERIPLSMEFGSAGLRSVMGGGCAEGALLAAVDDTAAVIDLRTEVWRDSRDQSPGGSDCGDEYPADAFQFAGPVFPGLGADYDRPIIPLLARERVDLTALVRFRRPGRYRVYVRTGFNAPIGRTPPRLSNILTLEIRPRDPVADAEELQRAGRELQSGDARAKLRALADLRRLGTNDVVDFVAGLPHTSLEVLAWSAPDRAHVVQRMTERLDDATRPIDWPFLWTLAALDATPTGGPVPRQTAIEARLRLYSVRRLRALAAAGRLDDALATEMQRASTPADMFARVRWELPAAGFPAFAPQVARAIEDLPAAGQRRLLTDQSGWREFIDPAFLPMWRRLAASRAEGGAQDVAWAMWRRHEPQAADRFARQEIRVRESQLGTNGLPGLVVPPTAALDAALVTTLEAATTPAQMERAASLVERFATARVHGRVASRLATSPLASTCPAGPVLLAYLFRVAPAVASRHIDDIAFAPYNWDEPCGKGGVLNAVGERFWSSDVERAAIRRLAPGPAAPAIDAAEALARHGSAMSKAALLDALDAWHRRWSAPATANASDGDARDWANTAIEAIANALEESASWRLSDADAARIQSRFLDARDARRWTGNRSTAEEPTPEIRVNPPWNPGAAPTFLVAHTWLTGADALIAQLRTFPKGTSWHWRSYPDAYEVGFSNPYPAQPSSMWLAGQEEALFAEVKRRAQALGQTVQRQ